MFKGPETDNRLKRKVLESNMKDGEIHTVGIADPGPAEEETTKYLFTTQ